MEVRHKLDQLYVAFGAASPVERVRVLAVIARVLLRSDARTQVS